MILRLAQARLLLWAKERATLPAFEVSKIVAQPLQPLCPSAPRCPGSASGARDLEELASGWIDPAECAFASCAYEFSVRGECLQHRNQLALEVALFVPSEAARTRRLLEALGYEVTEESVDSLQAGKILGAHGVIGPSHEIRLFQSPGVGPIVLVRRWANPRRNLQSPGLRARGARQP